MKTIFSIISISLLTLTFASVDFKIISPSDLKESYPTHGLLHWYLHNTLGFKGSAAAFGYNPYGTIVVGNLPRLQVFSGKTKESVP